MAEEGAVSVSDCTLRDTRNAPGVFFTVQEAVEIARRLDALGVDEIEIGGGGLTPDEAEMARAIHGLGLRAKTSTLIFCVTSEDIEPAVRFVKEVGGGRVMISLPSSDRFIELRLKRSFRATCKLVEKVVGYAVKNGVEVVFSGEDAARADPERLVDYVRAGAEAGASRFRFAESVSALEPEEMARRVGMLRERGGIDIDVHCHSAFGLAVANTVAGIGAGARWASCTVGGLGERGGNTPLEAIVLYLAHFRGRSDFNLSALKGLAECVSRATGIPIGRFASAVGDDAFQYEKGNMFRYCESYEAYPPERVGNRRQLVIGRKADPSALRAMLEMASRDPEDYDVEALAQRLQKQACDERRAMTPAELERVLESEDDGWKRKKT
jgi:homocitrate synthase NifV